MKSLKKTITSEFRPVAEKLENIITLCETSVIKRKGYKYDTDVSGHMNFDKTGSLYYFETIEEFREALALENIDDVYSWGIDIEVIEKSKTITYDHKKVLDLALRYNFRSGTDIDVSNSAYSFAQKLMDEIVLTLNASFYTEPELDPNKEIDEERSRAVDLSVEILENLPNLQSRIQDQLSSEKEVQDFLYPILKSHFSDLQEEDYLSKVAGTASKPDFGIEDLGIAFEIKYTHPTKNLKKLADEIAIDSRKYFGKGSPFKTMIVFIYNGSQEATPANYIIDLEHIDVISKVIISPKIIPRLK